MRAESYRRERDFAFFHVSFGTSKEEFLKFTELEKAFIRKEYEMRVVSDNTHRRNAFYNAYTNANRKKNKKFVELYKKKQEKADKEYNKNAIANVIEIEKRDGKSWVDKLYQVNGMKKPQRGTG